MKKIIVLISLIATVLGTVGCGRETSDYSDTYTTEQSGIVEEPYIEVETNKADYRICVDGVNVDINFYDGYKPYVLVLRSKENDVYSSSAFFMPVESDGSYWSLDDAKQNGLIHDYYLDITNGILVFNFKETERCLLMPVSRTYEAEFGSLGSYWFMWNDAYIEKIGLGGMYKKVAIFPDQDFVENNEVCAMKVICEGYSHAPMNYPAQKWFIFVDDVIDTNYPGSKVE